jgi:hypothetical protein
MNNSVFQVFNLLCVKRKGGFRYDVHVHLLALVCYISIGLSTSGTNVTGSDDVLLHY